MSSFRREAGVLSRFGVLATAAVMAASQLGAGASAPRVATASPTRAEVAAPKGVPAKVLTPQATGHARAANQAARP